MIDMNSTPASLPKAGLETAGKVCKLGLTTDEVVRGYNDWSKESKYEQHLGGVCYKGPLATAEAVACYLHQKKDVTILDVGAGTGLVASKLADLGFYEIDALDASEGMLEVAKGLNRYRKYFNVLFPPPVDTIAASSYDVLVCCGAFIDGHLECDALAEMVRCVKTGGLVIIAMREENLWLVPEYKDRLEPYMKQLEDGGMWIQLERTTIPEFFYHYSGVKFVFRVTKPAEEGTINGVET